MLGFTDVVRSASVSVASCNLRQIEVAPGLSNRERAGLRSRIQRERLGGSGLGIRGAGTRSVFEQA